MIGSSLSFIGSLCMMVHILMRHPMLRKVSTGPQLLFLLAFTAFTGAPFMFLNRFVVGNKGLCQAQGYSIQFTVLAMPILCLCISLHFYLILTNRGAQLREGNRYLYLSMALGLGIPFVLATATQLDEAFGNALIWCWIVKARDDLRYIMFYIPLWIIILMGIVLNIFAVLHVRSVEKAVARKQYIFTRNASKVFLYSMVFVICWIPGTTNRLHETVNGSSPHWMIIGHCFATTSLGFWASVVYFYLQYSKVQREGSHQSSVVGPNSSKITGGSY
jgi:uncharacterized membrane protein YidH (DUF202 family)